jgi:hypothetical protein
VQVDANSASASITESVSQPPENKDKTHHGYLQRLARDFMPRSLALEKVGERRGKIAGPPRQISVAFRAGPYKKDPS